MKDPFLETALLLFAGRFFAADFSARIASAHFAPLETGGASPLRQRMYALRALIAERCAESLPLSWLAEQAGLSRYHFVRAFKARIAATPGAYRRALAGRRRAQ